MHFSVYEEHETGSDDSRQDAFRAKVFRGLSIRYNRKKELRALAPREWGDQERRELFFVSGI
jgi:hypothetical protein